MCDGGGCLIRHFVRLYQIKEEVLADLLPFLGHTDDDIRVAAAQAIAVLGRIAHDTLLLDILNLGMGCSMKGTAEWQAGHGRAELLAEALAWYPARALELLSNQRLLDYVDGLVRRGHACTCCAGDHVGQPGGMVTGHGRVPGLPQQRKHCRGWRWLCRKPAAVQPSDPRGFAAGRGCTANHHHRHGGSGKHPSRLAGWPLRPGCGGHDTNDWVQMESHGRDVQAGALMRLKRQVKLASSRYCLSASPAHATGWAPMRLVWRATQGHGNSGAVGHCHATPGTHLYWGSAAGTASGVARGGASRVPLPTGSGVGGCA